MTGTMTLPPRVPTAAMRAIFWGAAAFVVTMALLPHPPALPIDPLGDKIEHMLAFSALSAAAALAYSTASLPRIAERLSFLGALVEVTQSIPALRRECDIRDWMADTVAIVVTLVILFLVRGIREPTM